MNRPAHVYKTYIRGSAEDVWDAITNPDKTVQYFYETLVESSWEVGAEMNYNYADGTVASTGHIIAIDPPKRLEFMFHAQWDEALAAEGPVREVWSLNETSGMVELKIELFDIGPTALEQFSNGLPYIVSGLKSLVETGEALPSGGD